MPSSNFKVLRQSGRFVDKTLFLKQLHARKKKLSVIFRPHGFGKTVIAEMTDCFYRSELDEHGNKVPQAERTNLSFFQDTKIWKDIDEMSHMGNYPLIHLRFNNIRCANFEDGLKEVMKAAYEEYDVYFDPQTNLEKSLERLIRALHDTYKKRVVVIIDEFDTPLNCLLSQFQSKSKEEDAKLKKFAQVYYDIIEAVMRRDDFALEFALLLGNLHLNYFPLYPHGDILPHDAEPSFLLKKNDDFSEDLFGFTKEEIIDWCFPKTIESHHTLLLKAMKKWYGGVRPNTRNTMSFEHELFIPHSVTSCIESGFVMDIFADLSKYPTFITKYQNMDIIIQQLRMLLYYDKVEIPVIPMKPIRLGKCSETNAILRFIGTLFQHGLIMPKYKSKINYYAGKRNRSVTNNECKIILWKKLTLASLVKKFGLNRSNYPKRGLVDSISNYKWSPKFTAHLEKYVLDILEI